MPEQLPKEIELSCPACRATVAVDANDPEAVRWIGSEKRPFVTKALLIRAECPECGRLIRQTVKTDIVVHGRNGLDRSKNGH